MWLAKLTEKGMLRASFVLPAPIRRLRDYTRLRTDLTHGRSRQVQRLEKLLEDALIKLSAVATDIMGVSGRAMIEALIAGQRDPKVLAGLARGRMKTKHSALVAAVGGRFDDQRGELARMLPDQIDALTTQIDTLRTRIDQLLAPMPDAQPVDPRPGGSTLGQSIDTVSDAALGAVDRLDEIPGIGPNAAQVILAEIGLDMSRFPTPRTWCRGRNCAHAPSSPDRSPVPARPARAHLTSMARSARPPPRPPRSTPSWANATGASSNAAASSRPLVTIARSILVIVWHLLTDSAARFHDLGSDYHTRGIDIERRMRNHIAQLSAMGYRVTSNPPHSLNLHRHNMTRPHNTTLLTSSAGCLRPAHPCRLFFRSVATRA